MSCNLASYFSRLSTSHTQRHQPDACTHYPSGRGRGAHQPTDGLTHACPGNLASACAGQVGMPYAMH